MTCTAPLAPLLPASIDAPFVGILVRQMRAHDTHNLWAKKPDAELLAPFIVTREQRRKLPIIADPDPRVIWRIEQFYNAVGLAVEQATGLIASPILKLSAEGFGRVVLIAGRLVVISRSLRDVHRFGFASMADLVQEGERLVSEAVQLIERYPDIAKL